MDNVSTSTPADVAVPETWDDVTERDLLRAILQQLMALNATIARVYAVPEPQTCCDQEKNRMELGTAGSPGLWMCRVCGVTGG